MTESILDTTNTDSSMSIENAQYIKDPIDDTVSIIRATIDGTDMWVGMSVGNRHYDEIMRQVESGELTIADAE